VIQQITANFDTFAEDDTDWSGQTHGVLGCLAGTSPPERQEFIGYTFKRKKDVQARATLAGAFAES
jgi:hypothetical protein